MSKKFIRSADYQPLAAPAEEQLIARNWCSTSSMPVVSIACTTYNHCDYIENALNGFLAQKTDFPFEIVIRDDASTDGTRDILAAYKKRYPNIIQLILENENKYSKGVAPLPVVIEATRGDYIAVCEGDDYWVSSDKLKSQYDALQESTNCRLCFHAAVKFNVITGSMEEYSKYRQGTGSVAGHEVIARKKGNLATASMMTDRESAISFSEFRKSAQYNMVGDITYQVISCLGGNAWYIDDVMCVHNVSTPMSWGVKIKNDPVFALKQRKGVIQTYKKLKGFAGEDAKKRNAIDKAIEMPFNSVLMNSNFKIKEKRHVFLICFKHVASFNRAKGLFICYFPFGLFFWKCGTKMKNN